MHRFAWLLPLVVAGCSKDPCEGVSGACVGVSFLDGLARIDLARGVDPRTVWRVHLYVEAAF